MYRHDLQVTENIDISNTSMLLSLLVRRLFTFVLCLSSSSPQWTLPWVLARPFPSAI